MASRFEGALCAGLGCVLVLLCGVVNGKHGSTSTSSKRHEFVEELSG